MMSTVAQQRRLQQDQRQQQRWSMLLSDSSDARMPPAIDVSATHWQAQSPSDSDASSNLKMPAGQPSYDSDGTGKMPVEYRTGPGSCSRQGPPGAKAAARICPVVGKTQVGVGHVVLQY
eukprot:TRINITY_DN1990_c2_g1_i1.p2 TRINITY_DN1990_c2_g1~~TRINITY_DN1990_c2_g1_i1.p2  ORF type:complete len:119 (-),score=31.13 TRINITY_DN1990_c2_g1_i1:86-442(-)